jgi:NAD(P)-dependent dehydrogenase (short-subunit alcohol dehydrogenase family)
VKPVALVTGALGGIGLGVVALLEATHDVIGWDVQSNLPPQAHESVHFATIDHRDAEAVAAAAEGLPNLSIVICLAGCALPEEVEVDASGGWPNPSLFAESIRLNLVGHYNVLYGIREHLVPGASVVLVSSVNAIQAFGLPAYSAAKAGLHGLVVSLSSQLGARGVRVNAIALGTVDTPASRIEWAHIEDRFESVASQSSLGHVATIAEASQAIVALATSVPHITGQVIVIDGGQSVFRSVK